jgi:hypothetical protein
MLISECCGAPAWLGNPDHERCGDCKEWCEFIDEDEQDFVLYNRKEDKVLKKIYNTRVEARSDSRHHKGFSVLEIRQLPPHIKLKLNLTQY